MKKLMMAAAGAAFALAAGAAETAVAVLPEVFFGFDDPTVIGWQANEGTCGNDVSICGSYSALGGNQGATYVETLGGYGVHSYSPWCDSISLGNEFTIRLRLRATAAENRILFCLGQLRQSGTEALMLTSRNEKGLKLVVVKGTTVLREASIPVDDVAQFNTYVLRYVNGMVTVNVNGASEACCSIAYTHARGVFQLLGGYDKQNEMTDYFHGCGSVNSSTWVVTAADTSNVIDDFIVWTQKSVPVEVATDGVAQIILGEHPNVAAEWTYGDGSVTNSISGSSFNVIRGVEDVKVVLTVIPDGLLTFADGARQRIITLKKVTGTVDLTQQAQELVWHLPEGYTAVDYVVVPRWAYVDTGYQPNQDTHVTMDVTVQGPREYWFGCWDWNWNDHAYALGNDLDGVYAGYGDDGGTQGAVVSSGRRHVVELSNHDVKVDGSVARTMREQSFRLSHNLYLFAQNRQGTATPGAGQGDIICHGCTIHEGSVAVRNFMPCVRMSDMTVGLYDLTETGSVPGGAFYANAGDGTFGVPDGIFCTVTIGAHPHTTVEWTYGDGSVTNSISGSSIIVPKGVEDVKFALTVISGHSFTFADGARQRIISLDKVTEDVDLTQQAQELVRTKVNLPEGYRAVDYIVAPCGSYVDTGHKPYRYTHVTMDVTVQSAREYWFGCRERGDRNDIVYELGNDVDGLYAGYGYVDDGGTRGAVVSTGQRHTVELLNTCVKVDGSYTRTMNGRYIEFKNSNLYLFAHNRYGGATPGSGQGDIICHGCTITDDVLWYRNYVPCVRMSDMTAGLYDLTYKGFYANAGSGTFGVPDGTFCTVTIGARPNVVAEWTYGGGSVTNQISGSSFNVIRGDDVKVVFKVMAGLPFAFSDGSRQKVVPLGKVTEDVDLSQQAKELVGAEVEVDLPDGYTPLEWISSDGGQYIDTEYVHKADTRIECTLEAAETQPNPRAAVFGARKDNFNNNAFCFFAACDGAGLSKPCYNRTGEEMRGTAVFPGGQAVGLTCEGQSAFWSGAVYGSIKTTGTADVGVNSMFVFDLNTAGQGGKRNDASGIAMKLYSFRICEGSVAVRNFVPCVRMSDQAVGLCDLVASEPGKAFYANAGSGTFGVPDGTFCTVTVGERPNVVAEWTYVGGSHTNLISGSSFNVIRGMEDVEVVLTVMSGHPFTFADGSRQRIIPLEKVTEDVDLSQQARELVRVEVDLPDGYVPLEWISSDGGQYVDTEYVHKADSRVECTFEAAVAQTRPWAAVFGARKDSFHNNAFCFFVACDGAGLSRPCYNRTGNEMRGTTAFPGGKAVELTCEGQSAFWSGAGVASGSITTTGTVDAGVNSMFVFDLNTAGQGGKRNDTSGIAMKLYSFRICEGSVTVRNFVPCVRMSDQAVGLCDLAASEPGKVFYANAGSGAFGVPDGTFCTVILGSLSNMTAAYTFGDGSVTNAVSGESFRVLKCLGNVKVIFTANEAYALEGKTVFDVNVGDESEVSIAEDVPTAKLRPTFVKVVSAKQRWPWNGKVDVGYALLNTDSDEPRRLITTVTVGDATKAVTNELDAAKDGNYTTTVDCTALFGADVLAPASVTMAVLATEPNWAANSVAFTLDTQKVHTLDLSAGLASANLACSGDSWGEAVGESATITFTRGGGTSQSLATGLTGNGTVPWTPQSGGTYVFRHTVGDVTETATFKVLGFGVMLLYK